MQSKIKTIIDRIDWTEERNDTAWTAVNEITHLIYPESSQHNHPKKVYGLLIMDTNQPHIPSYLFASTQERSEYIKSYELESYRLFDYTIEQPYAETDIAE